MNESTRIEEAIRAANHVRRAYEDPSAKPGNAQVRVDYNPSARELHISVAGSNDWTDWRQNFSMGNRRELLGIGKVHPGFWEHASLVMPVIEQELGKHIPILLSGLRIRLAGHSAGAAVAVLLLVRYPILCADNVTTWLFGCPRVGNSDFAAFHRNNVLGKVWNVQSAGDPVCAMPPPILGWRHVGEIMRIGRHDPRPDHPLSAYVEALAQESRALWRVGA